MAPLRGLLSFRLPITLALGGFAVLVALALGRIPLVQTLELKTYDLRMRQVARPGAARSDIVVVAIDQESLRQMDPLVGRWPWPRLVHGQLLDFLAAAPARAVLYDVLFTEHDRRSFMVGSEQWTGEESDRVLAASAKRAGNVVVMADVVAEPTERAAAGPASAAPALPAVAMADYRLGVPPEERPVVVLPFDELARAAAAIGHNFLLLDPDGPLRRVVPFVRSGSRPIPSGPLAAALMASRLTPDRVAMTRDALTIDGRPLPLIEEPIASFYGEGRTGYRTLLNFRGEYRRYSFYDLFYSAQQMASGVKPDIDPAEFRDKVVIVGTTAPGLSDVFSVPLRGKFSGAEVHANFIDSVMSGRFMAPSRRSTALALVAGGAAVVAAAAVWWGPWAAMAVALGGGAATWWAALAAFRAGVWVPITPPSVAIALAAFGGTAYHYVVEGREKRKVKHLFSRFVSRDVYEQLLDSPQRAALGGTRRDMTVLFSDIRGFTTLAEQADPEATVATLNEFFTRMVPIVFAHGGTVDKFVGDMIMALFGAPLDDADHADHAVGAALAMCAELDRLNAGRAAAGLPPLDIGIGINSGDMVAGLIGSERILSYTVIGDAVNLGSRLEGANKQYGTRLIISETTRQRLRKRYDMRPLGEITVKGRSQPVSIFEVKASS